MSTSGSLGFYFCFRFTLVDVLFVDFFYLMRGEGIQLLLEGVHTSNLKKRCIQKRRAIIRAPTKRHLNGVSLAGR